MNEEPLGSEASLALLRHNLERLSILTGGVPAQLLRTTSEPDEWSPSDVLAHIRACCDVWGGNIDRILAEEHATFPGMNPRTWMARTDYPDWPFDAAFATFSAQRQELLRTLERLTPDDWERSATVVSFGQANERTVRSYVSKLAKHERTHVRQIERTLNPSARQRREPEGSEDD